MKKNKKPIKTDAELLERVQTLIEKYKLGSPAARRKSLVALSQFIEEQPHKENKDFFIDLKNKLESFALEVTDEN